MDLFFLLLFIGCLLGAAAFFTETHLHGIPQFIAIVVAVLMVASTGSAAFLGEALPHWVLMVAKIMAAIGLCTLAGYIAHHFHSKVAGFLAWAVAIGLSCLIVAYTPGIGFGSPFPTSATRPAPSPGTSPPPPPSVPPAAPALPAGTAVGPAGFPPVPCGNLPYDERVARGC